MNLWNSVNGLPVDAYAYIVYPNIVFTFLKSSESGKRDFICVMILHSRFDWV